MTLRIFPIFLDKNGKICPSMQCQTNFSSFLKVEKFCPSVGRCRSVQSSGFLSPLSLCRATMARRKSVYFFSKFFKILLKNFAPVYHGVRLRGIPESSLHFPVSELSQGFRAGSRLSSLVLGSRAILLAGGRS
jgi:hypothetical protein